MEGKYYTDIYDVIERFSIMTIDGELTDEEALHYCIRHCKPPLMQQFIQSINSIFQQKNELVGDFAFFYFIEHKIGLLPMYENKKKIEKIVDETTGKWRADCYITTLDELQAVILGKGNRRGAGRGTSITCFSFNPQNAGLIVFDIDTKHDGINGLANWYNFLKSIYGGMIPTFLQDVTKYPCYVTTPHGGYHLYFRYKGNKQFGNTSIVDDVEIKHKDITAPGSKRDGKDYILHGKLEYAPELPKVIENRLTTNEGTTQLQQDIQKEVQSTPKKYCAPHNNRNTYTFKTWKYKTLDELYSEAITGKVANNHNTNQYLFANKVGWYSALLQYKNKNTDGYTFTATLDYVQTHISEFGSGSDTKIVIKRAYEHGLHDFTPKQ